MKDYFVLSFKNLKRRGIRSWLTLLGIFIGVAAVVSLISLGDGLKTAVNSQFGVSNTQLLTVQAGGAGYGLPGAGAIEPLTIYDSDAIGKLSSIEKAVSVNIKSVKLEFNKKTVISVAVSVPEKDKRLSFYQYSDLKADQGRLLDGGDSNKVVLGHGFLDSKKNGFDKTISLGESIIIQGKDFRVVGILEKKGSFMWDNSVLINDGPMRDLLNLGNNVDQISAKAKSKELVPKAKEEIEKLLRERRNVKIGEENFEVSTPEAALATINSVLSGVQIFIVIIALISIIVGAIGIINTMTTSVLERRKEIGVMKAIGARNSQVFLQFFIEAGLLGFFGGLAGAAMGLAVGYIGTIAINNFAGSSVTPKIDFLLLSFSLAGSFLIGSIAGILPAMRAARQNPVEALRG